MASINLDRSGDAVPHDADAALRVAAALGLAIPIECQAGVLTNLALLNRHAAVFLATDPL